MLIELHIRDLAVVEAVDLEFAPGFTALTGETGAGKSILVDALALALGERADAQAVRSGASRLDVSAAFDLEAHAAAAAWLVDAELDDDGHCTLRRVVGADGRSRAWINGRPVAVQTLREFGALLVDICGQQDYQSLGRPARQRELLDALGEHGPLLDELRAAHARWREADEARRQRLSARHEREARVEWLRFQVEELDALAPAEGEFAALEQEDRRAEHRTRIAGGLTLALARLYDDDGAAQDAIGESRRALEELLDVDPALEPAVKLLAEAEIQLGEAADLIRHRADSLEHDPAREAELTERLDAMQALARKHRVQPGELPGLHRQLAEELESLTGAAGSAEELERLVMERRGRLEALAARVSRTRRKLADQLAGAVTANMAELGMAAGRFEVRVDERPAAEIGPDGADDIEFLVTTNPGQPPGPLSRIASGGELSRLNLAIQVVATRRSGAPTLIFDEVDAGVGGAVAEIVGRQLRSLGEGRQVLCITHLPQVAALAGHQASVSKASDGDRTLTTVRPLSPAERVEEIARMLGGVKITARTRAHAKEMLQSARDPSLPSL